MKKIFKSKRVITLVIILAITTLTIASISTYTSYKTTMMVLKTAMNDIADDERSFIETLYHNGFSEDSIRKILKQAHQKHQSIGKTGEFVIAKSVVDKIQFIYRQDLTGITTPKEFLVPQNFAEPIKLSLRGLSGSIIGNDYKGEKVIAGYSYIEDVKWGVVAKIDLAEVNQPFKISIILTSALALLFVALGSWLFIRTTNPMIYGILKSEQKFKTIFNHSGDSSFIIGLNGKIFDVNQALCNLLKYSREELLKFSLIDIITARNSFINEETIIKIIEDSNLIFECELKDKSGNFIQVEINSSIIEFNEDKAILSIARDISERKRTEAALFAEKERLSVTLQSIGDAVITTDAQGKIVLMNKVAEDLTGWNQNDSVGRDLSGVFHIINQQTREICANPVELVLKNGTIVGLANHTAIISRDGTEKIIADSGSPIRDKDGRILGVILVFRDETEKYKSEQALIESEERYKLLFQRSPLGYQSLDAEGNFIEVNQVWLDTLGYENSEVVGHWFGEFLYGDYVQAFRERFPKFKEVGEVHDEFLMKHKDGSIRTIAFDGKIGYDKNRNFKQTHCVLRDITKLKLIEAALKENERKFRSLFETMTEGVAMHEIVYDKNGKPVDYKLIDVNSAFETNTGISCNLAKGALASELYKSKIPPYFDIYCQVEETCSPYSFETFFPPMQKHFSIKVISAEKGTFVTIFDDITNRKNLENQLRENESRFRSIIENTNAGYFFIDNDGIIREVNSAWIELYKYESKDEVIGKHYIQIQNIDDIEKSKEIVRGIMSGDPSFTKGEFSRKCKDGSIGYHTFSSKPVVKKGEVIGIEGFIIDSTESKLAQKTIKESEEKYRRIVEYSPDAIVIHSEGKIVYANHATSLLLGVESVEQFMNLPAINFVHPDSRELAASRIKKIMETGEASDFTEEKFIKLNNDIINVEVIGIPITYLGKPSVQTIIRDITSRKIVEDSLLKSEERFRRAIEEAPFPIMIHSEDGRVVAISNALTEITGYTLEDIPTMKDWTRLAYGKDHKTILASIDHLFKLNRRIDEGEYVINTKENVERIWDFSSAPLGELIDGKRLIISMAKDVTDRKQMEEELLHAKDKAEESDYLKSAFLANMSHEIRTPMHAILGFSQLLSSSDIEEDEKQEYIHFIHKRGHDLLNIINDILDISKIEANQLTIHKSKGDVNIVLEELFAVFNSMDEFETKKPIELKIGSILSGNASIITDFARLKQILINLLSNAKKFTAQGTIEFGCNLTNDNMLHFYVKDTGIGIPVDKHKIIFERFRQGDEKQISRQYGGTGLGLSISKGLVELLGGTIWVESEENKGSTFNFTIPYSPSGHVKEKPEDVRLRYFDWTGKTVLIVEDDDFNARLLDKVLSKTKINYIIAKDGKTALETFKTSKAIDIVLMDIQLPDINGFEVTKEMLKINPEIKIIAQTAYAFDDDKKACLEAGCCNYLSKPLDIDSLLNMVNRYLYPKS